MTNVYLVSGKVIKVTQATEEVSLKIRSALIYRDPVIDLNEYSAKLRVVFVDKIMYYGEE